MKPARAVLQRLPQMQHLLHLAEVTAAGRDREASLVYLSMLRDECNRVLRRHRRVRVPA